MHLDRSFICTHNRSAFALLVCVFALAVVVAGSTCFWHEGAVINERSGAEGHTLDKGKTNNDKN